VTAGLRVVVGVGELAVSSDPGELLVTYALGSCVGVAAHDARAGVGGLLHFMLPNSAVNPEKARELPGMFGDVGLPFFLTQLFERGASRKHLVVKLAGGAEINGPDGFEIGKRNILLARRLLWKNAIVPAAEAVGGRIGRTMRLDMATGKVFLKDPDGERELLEERQWHSTC
jgi:chemotaxis protein CheD